MGMDTTSPADPPRRRRLRDVALASGIVPVADLEAAAARVRIASTPDGPATADEAAVEAHAASGSLDAAGADALQRRWDTALADELVSQGTLTRFQAREMLAGRTRFKLGQYTVIDEVGRGGMGQVFKAEHALMGRLVAVKVLPRSKATPESEAAFQREMRILGRLDHENLVRAFDAGYDAMVYYLVTELVPGVDLRQFVRRHGPLDETAAAAIFAQVAGALAFAHDHRLVHRDVKPGNILVTDDGRAKLLDLGLAGSTLEAEALRLGRVVGTMDYIAPEQIRSPDDVGPSADIYALGCSLYFALCGEVPFPGGTRKEKMQRHLAEIPTPLRRLAPHVPEPLCHLVESMMEKSPTDRPESAREVVARLQPWTPERPVPLRDHPGLALPRAAADAGPAARAWQATRGWLQPVGARAVARLQGALTADRAGAAVAILGRLLVVPVLTGIAFSAALELVRRIDAERFQKLLGPVTPATCGWVAFLVMLALQAAAMISTGRPRRRSRHGR